MSLKQCLPHYPIQIYISLARRVNGSQISFALAFNFSHLWFESFFEFLILCFAKIPSNQFIHLIFPQSNWFYLISVFYCCGKYCLGFFTDLEWWHLPVSASVAYHWEFHFAIFGRGASRNCYGRSLFHWIHEHHKGHRFKCTFLFQRCIANPQLNSWYFCWYISVI